MKLFRAFQWGVILSISSILLFAVTGMAQKQFEGYWEETTISKTQMPTGKRTETTQEKVFYKKGKMKTVDLEPGDITIIRLDKGLMWDIDQAEGTYTEMTFAQMRKAAEESRKAMQQLREEFKDMPPEQREMMEKMMPGKEGKIKMSFKKTGKTQTVSGYKCEHWVMETNDAPFMDLWVMDEFDVGGDLMEAYKNMGVIKVELTDEMKKFRGFVMKSHFSMDMGMGKVETTTTVTKIVKTSISDKEFELPKGLKKIEVSMPPMKE